MLRKICFLLALIPSFIGAQQTTEYPTDYLSPAFHAGRRAAFIEKMPANSVAFFFASQVRVRNNDIDFQYAQSKNFYYLTGLEEPNALLLLFKEPITILDKTGTEFIFVQNRDPLRELWTGKILGTEGVKSKYGITNAFTNNQFNANIIDLKKYDSVLTLFRNEDILMSYAKPDQLSRMAKITDSLLYDQKIPVAARRTSMIMSILRGIKQPEEIAILEKAAAMSCEGHNDVMRATKPGMQEYQAQAIMEYHFKNNGSEYPGYWSINGSSDNACVLHYTTNLRKMNSGDALLSDCAAEYHGYSADVTRTIPVNGKFTDEQRIIYELVLEAQDSGIAAAKPGMPMAGVDAAARSVIYRGLKKLGIINTDAEGRKYFPHGTSHHLGLDVHDMGPRIFEEGVYITVEPGIYIPSGSNCDKKWWRIGVRIEDDILITKDGNRNLSAAAPRKVKDIEKMMKEKSIF
jgi:Xaa-Pro aminopeptidase